MPMPRKPTPERRCANCFEPMERKMINGRLEDLGAFMRRVYCGRACMAEAFVKDTSLDGSKRRRVTRSRGTTCESCGATTNLHAHHCDGNLDNDSPENIQTLCGSCHATHHHHARRVGLTVPGRKGSPG